MIKCEFCSKSKYLKITRNKQPRYFLAIGTSRFSRNSFELLQPHSQKGRFLKLFLLLFVKIGFLNVLKKKSETSQFIKNMELYFKTEIISSIYFSSDGLKAIIQLQSVTDNRILAYVKIALTSKGNNRIENEVRAIKTLMRANLIDHDFMLFHDLYEDRNFVVLKNQIKTEKYLSPSVCFSLLDEFKRGNPIELRHHPRIISLQQTLKHHGDLYLDSLISIAIRKSKTRYTIDYEHGDFTPWNIIATTTGPALIDFEHFNDQGISLFDTLKFFYQQCKLIMKLDPDEVYLYLKHRIKTEDFDNIFVIFIINEILILEVDKQSCALEYKLIAEIVDKW